MKNTTAREGPSPWLDSLMEKRGIAILWARPAKGEREKKERFALLIEARRQGRREEGGGERKCKQEQARRQRHGTSRKDRDPWLPHSGDEAEREAGSGPLEEKLHREGSTTPSS